jgi:uncharacterized protein YggT (Ycf19 family)
MPVEIQKEVTTQSSGPVSSQVSQTATTAQVPTNSEQKEEKTDRGNAWVWYIIGIIDLLLLLRGLFHLLGAKTVGFANLLYGITDFLVAPFRGIFPDPKVEGSYFDMASLVAIIVYVLLGWVVVRLINLSTRPAGSEKA